MLRALALCLLFVGCHAPKTAESSGAPPLPAASSVVRDVILELAEATSLGEALFRTGLAYEVGKKGNNLSGGQRQLVALGRAVLRDTPVLILDEPTSALDPVSTERVLRALDAWRHDRILITVSHDPRVVMSADEARVMEGGAIVASGSVADLWGRGGPLRRCLSA